MEQELKTILVAEDEEINRSFLREIFKGEYHLLEAENGHQAIYHIKSQGDRLSLIILDIHMPKLDGFGVMDYLRENALTEKIPVIITTSDQSTDVLLSAKQSKVADIVYKPFHLKDIKRRVNNLIELCKYENDLDSILEEQSKYLSSQYETMIKLRAFQKKSPDAAWKAVMEELIPGITPHNERMQEYVKLIADKTALLYPKYGLEKAEIQMIADAVSLHDIGKLVISDEVFDSSGAEANRVYIQIRRRPIAASELISMIFENTNLKMERKYCFDICRHMYEKYDGKGFPEGLKGDEIPISAQIVSLAHRYEELRFRGLNNAKPLTHAEVMRKILQGEFRSFNPDLLEVFEDCSPMIEEISNKGGN